MVMDPETIAYIVVAVLITIKLAVYVVYKRVIKKAEQDALAQESSPKQDIWPT